MDETVKPPPDVDAARDEGEIVAEARNSQGPRSKRQREEKHRQVVTFQARHRGNRGVARCEPLQRHSEGAGYASEACRKKMRGVG